MFSIFLSRHLILEVCEFFSGTYCTVYYYVQVPTSGTAMQVQYIKCAFQLI